MTGTASRTWRHQWLREAKRLGRLLRQLLRLCQRDSYCNSGVRKRDEGQPLDTCFVIWSHWVPLLISWGDSICFENHLSQFWGWSTSSCVSLTPHLQRFETAASVSPPDQQIILDARQKPVAARHEAFGPGAVTTHESRAPFTCITHHI